jgi:8-oxo-dGTP diphosphatase
MSSKYHRAVATRPRIVLVNRAFVVSDGKLLLIQRATKNSWAPGKWEIPGGKLDKGQDVSHALEREVLEETGLTVTPISRVAFVDSELITEGRYKGLPYVCLIGICQLLGGKIRLSGEHRKYRWVTIEAAFDLDLTGQVRKALAVLSAQLQWEASKPASPPGVF